MLRGRPALPLRHAVALGLVQGPTELLPVSSSGHTTLIPFLAGWPYAELDPELRKSFEVALHAGAGLALMIDMRAELFDAIAGLDRRRATVAALALAPPALAGYLLQPVIERRFGHPGSIAAGLAAGGIAMAAADARAARRVRTREQVSPRDGLALGLAQAMALLPGVSRSGATLTAARARGFGRSEARALSWHAALPVIVGASALQGARLIRVGPPPGARTALAAGGAAAFVSTLLSARILGRGRHDETPLLRYSLYRCLLAGLVARRLMSARGEREPWAIGAQ
jgi:undecaprenyl-diphosphatase